ncbi:uncharacterized protein LOC123533918 isoform X2 [Mercenaria mercenaria]|uniref:uncharacterized protein LOC123533918 isoform X2 n=1 Tax=Mercenaria mercenaria TaxID=6596 RepID=UPI00234FAAAF|nr:uncharacterized protein LOC123533918 isoform X2 [Mercenaria mercenaria]
MPDVFKEGCAFEKICLAGEEPHLSFKESGKTVTYPVVYCRTCHEDNTFNRNNISSSKYITCEKKWNDCSKGKHKILCKPDVPTDDRFCRCDARKGYYPFNYPGPVEKCSYENYDCRNYKQCKATSNGKPQQLLLDYTCAPYCDEGFGRLDNNSDECLPIPSSSTIKISTSLSTLAEGKTKAVSSIYSTTERQKPELKPTSPDNTSCDYKDGKLLVSWKTPSNTPVRISHYIVKYRIGNQLLKTEKINSTQTSYSFSSLKRGQNLPLWIYAYSFNNMSNHSDKVICVISKDADGNNTSDVTSNSTTIVIISVTVGLIFLISVVVILSVLYCKSRTAPVQDSQMPQPALNPLAPDEPAAQPMLPLHQPEKQLVSKGSKDKASSANKQKRAPLSEQEDVSTPNLFKKRSSEKYSKDDDKYGESAPSVGPLDNDDCNQKAKGLFSAPDYRLFKNSVLMKSFSSLVELMEPKYLIDEFTSKDMYTLTVRRDMTEKQDTSEKNRFILDKLLQNNTYYDEFKECLSKLKQTGCLDVINEKEILVLKEMQATQNKKLTRGMSVSAKHSDEITNRHAPEDPYEEERAVIAILNDLAKAKDFREFRYRIKKVKERTEGNASLFECPNDCVATLKSPKNYRNCPAGFQSYYSSGYEMCCLYQSISRLLCGKENYQHRLRLKATLHAFQHYEWYKQQLQMHFKDKDVDSLKQELYGFVSQRTYDIIANKTDVNEIIEESLKALVMETACIGTDSSRLHVCFLSGAIGMVIKEFFELETLYGKLIEDLLSAALVSEGILEKNRQVLHIFWVDVNEEGKTMNHIVPLLRKSDHDMLPENI